MTTKATNATRRICQTVIVVALFVIFGPRWGCFFVAFLFIFFEVCVVFSDRAERIAQAKKESKIIVPDQHADGVKFNVKYEAGEIFADPNEVQIGSDTIYAGFRFGMSQTEFYQRVGRYNARFDEKMIVETADGSVMKYKIRFDAAFYRQKLYKLTIKAVGTRANKVLIDKYTAKYGPSDDCIWNYDNTRITISPAAEVASRLCEITYTDCIFDAALQRAISNKKRLEEEAGRRRMQQEQQKRQAENDRDRREASKFMDMI